MAYEIHILRTADAGEISLQEWHAVCAADPSLELQEQLVGINPRTGETIVLGETDAASWRSPVSGDEYLFDYRRGRISFVHDDELIIKAKDIARALGARVEGDEGEAY
ncbi:hypothetical protein [Pseudomonas sp. CF161]|uniref:hypothetical protein n=1 Tax=Pseudomonas sp. CF161 TaxID=911241 RepID=UPI0003551357|nr:hypothetical protein [Pseudomonas sp. CF161]EPL06891.1 hypothetical protein CF161_18949 [Pseudomonas sp. CF161]